MEWQKVKLGQFLKNREGRYKPTDIAIKGLKRIDKINFSGTIFLSDKPSNTDMILVKKGDLVISGINVEKGAMNVYEGDEDVVATIHYSSYCFDEEQIDINFLTHFLKSLEFKKALKEQVPGGIKTEIKPKHILPLLVEIPIDLKDQKKIVNKLMSNNYIVENINSELNHQLNIIKQLRQAFLREAIQGQLVKNIKESETGQQLLDKIKIEKATLIAEKKLKKETKLSVITADEIPFEIPKHWVWCRLGEIIYGTDSGKSPNCQNEPVKDNQWGVIKTTAVQEMFFLENENKLLPEKFVVNDQHIIHQGDILITRAGPKNRVGIVCSVDNISKNLILSDKTIRIKFSKKLLSSKYFTIALNSSLIKKTIEKKMTGMADSQVNITQNNIKNFLVPLPPLEEQKKIVKKIDELLIISDNLENTIKNSQNYNETLLQQVLKEALQPNESIKTISFERKKIVNPLKTILAGHIINLNNTTDFGRVKFQKLLFLTEYICKIDFDSNYVKKVAGPYDDTLIKNIENDFNRMRFFNVVQDKTDNKRVRYTALAGADELENLFLENFPNESVKINNTLLKFRPLSWEECELIATLYAVWNNRIIKNEPITDELLYIDFMAWDKKKIKYQTVFYKWLFWMKDERIIPDGWGKYIDMPK